MEWTEAEWKRVWDSRKAANLLDQIIRPLAQRCREAEEQVKRYDGYHSKLIIENEELRAQLAAAQARVEELEEINRTLTGCTLAAQAREHDVMQKLTHGPQPLTNTDQ